MNNQQSLVKKKKDYSLGNEWNKSTSWLDKRKPKKKKTLFRHYIFITALLNPTIISIAQTLTCSNPFKKKKRQSTQLYFVIY